MQNLLIQKLGDLRWQIGGEETFPSDISPHFLDPLPLPLYLHVYWAIDLSYSLNQTASRNRTAVEGVIILMFMQRDITLGGEGEGDSGYWNAPGAKVILGFMKLELLENLENLENRLSFDSKEPKKPSIAPGDLVREMRTLRPGQFFVRCSSVQEKGRKEKQRQ